MIYTFPKKQLLSVYQPKPFSSCRIVNMKDRFFKGDRRYWRNLALFTLAVVLVIAAFLVTYLSYTRTMLLTHPGRTLPLRTPSDVGLDHWREVSFLSEDGLRLSAWYIPVKEIEPSPALIYVHGLGSNREELLDQARLLCDHGYSALLLDLRNHGQSEGFLTTLGYLESLDVGGAIKFLLDQPEIDEDRIGLVGHSLGGGIVIRAAARFPEVKATVAESAFTSLEDNIEEGVRQLLGLPPFPFAPMVIYFGERETGLDIQQMRPIDDLSQIFPRAIMFVHGRNDPVVLVSNSQNLYDEAQEPKALYIIENASHDGLIEADPDEFERQVVGFLDTYLK
jgi:pimeloyl-ACP methyl ester carboxylesterase